MGWWANTDERYATNPLLPPSTHAPLELKRFKEYVEGRIFMGFLDDNDKSVCVCNEEDHSFFSLIFSARSVMKPNKITTFSCIPFYY